MEDWREITKEMTTDEQHQYMQKHGILTDCTFVVGPKYSKLREFKAHRVYVARVSPVFEAMLLRGEMVKAKTGRVSGVRVTDLSSNTFQLLLNFIYGKEPETTSYKEAEDLALAAQKYQIKALLQNCVTRMSALITPENIWTAFATADLLEETRLKETCVKVLRCNILRCINDPGFMQASEENVALLLQQDELNVDDELLLVNAVVHWARHAARQPDLSGDDSGVRAVLELRLLKLLRFLAMSPQQFMLGPCLSSWLTEDEKSAIEESIQSGDFSIFPQHLPSVAEKLKNVTFQIQGKNTSDQFICKREIVGSRPNVQQFINPCSYEYTFVHAFLTFKVNSSCWLLGVQCSSRYRADCQVDPTAFVAKKPVYHDRIYADIYTFNHTLSIDFQRTKCSHMSFHQETEYNSTNLLLLKTPLHLVPNNLFALEVWILLHKDEALGEYPNPKRSSRVCTAEGVEFEFRTEEQEGSYSSLNDGIFESLICSL